MKTIQDIFTKHLERYPLNGVVPISIRSEIESIRADIAKLKVFLIPELIWNKESPGRYYADSPCGRATCHWNGHNGYNVEFAARAILFTKKLDQAKSAAQEHFNSKMQEGLLPA